jgi:hypothetical protein
LPDDRNCFDSNIPEDYCPCFPESIIPVVEAEEPALALLDYLNDFIEKHADGGDPSDKVNHSINYPILFLIVSI